MTGGEKYLESFSEYLDADLIIGGYMRVKNNEMVNDNYWDFLPEGLYYSCEKFLGDNLSFLIFRVPWAKLFKRSIAETLKFDNKIRVGEDSLYVLEYLSNITSLRVLGTLADRSRLYSWVEPTLDFFQKYQITVQQAIYNTIRA